MTGMTIIHSSTTDAVSALIVGLEHEFGSDAGRALADRFLTAEDTDFCWDARIEERFLGAYDSLDEEEFELDRVAIIGHLDGAWFTGICIVDGEGHAHGMISQRHHVSARAARKAWSSVH